MGHQRVGDETARWPDHLEVPYAEVLWEGCTAGQDYLCLGSRVWAELAQDAPGQERQDTCMSWLWLVLRHFVHKWRMPGWGWLRPDSGI